MPSATAFDGSGKDVAMNEETARRRLVFFSPHQTTGYMHLSRITLRRSGVGSVFQYILVKVTLTVVQGHGINLSYIYVCV